MPPNHRTDKRQTQPAGLLFLNQVISSKKLHEPNLGEAEMGMVMIKCPQTGRAIPTGIETDRERFQRCAVFFSRTRCPICRTDHPWFAREAWVREPRARAEQHSANAPA